MSDSGKAVPNGYLSAQIDDTTEGNGNFLSKINKLIRIRG